MRMRSFDIVSKECPLRLWLGEFSQLLSVQNLRDHTVYGLSQWETTLQCNVVSYWLTPYTELPPNLPVSLWSCMQHRVIFDRVITGPGKCFATHFDRTPNPFSWYLIFVDGSNTPRRTIDTLNIRNQMTASYRWWGWGVAFTNTKFATDWPPYAYIPSTNLQTHENPFNASMLTIYDRVVRNAIW